MNLVQMEKNRIHWIKFEFDDLKISAIQLMTRNWNGVDTFYLLSVMGNVLMVEVKLENRKLKCRIVKKADEISMPFISFYPNSNYVVQYNQIFDISKPFSNPQSRLGLHFQTTSFFGGREILSDSNGNKIIVQCSNSMQNTKMLNYQFLVDSKENITSGVDFAPQRTVASPICPFVCNNFVIDVVRDIERLRRLMDFYLPNGIMREILFYA